MVEALLDVSLLHGVLVLPQDAIAFACNSSQALRHAICSLFHRDHKVASDLIVPDRIRQQVSSDGDVSCAPLHVRRAPSHVESSSVVTRQHELPHTLVHLRKHQRRIPFLEMGSFCVYQLRPRCRCGSEGLSYKSMSPGFLRSSTCIHHVLRGKSVQSCLLQTHACDPRHPECWGTYSSALLGCSHVVLDQMRGNFGQTRSTFCQNRRARRARPRSHFSDAFRGRSLVVASLGHRLPKGCRVSSSRGQYKRHASLLCVAHPFRLGGGALLLLWISCLPCSSFFLSKGARPRSGRTRATSARARSNMGQLGRRKHHIHGRLIHQYEPYVG